MNKRITQALVLALLVMCGVHAGHADEIPVDSWIEVGFEDPSLTQVVVYADPAGHYGLYDAYDNGTPVDATLKVRVVVDSGAAANFDRTRLKLVILDGVKGQAGGETIRDCSGVFTAADDNTNRMGWTTFSSRLFVHRVAQGAPYDVSYAIYVDWGNNGVWTLEYQGDNIEVRTADLNDDAQVNVSDVQLFASYYYNGTYDAVADFNGDGAEDASDVMLLSTSMNAVCSGAARSVGVSTDWIMAEMQKFEAENVSTWGVVKSRYKH